MEGVEGKGKIWRSAEAVNVSVEFHDLRQTREWANYLQQIGWRSLRIFNSQFSIFNYLHIRKMPLLPFSVAKLQRLRGDVNFEGVEELCKKHRVVVLYYEPNLSNQVSPKSASTTGQAVISNHGIQKQLRQLGFRKAKSSYLPRKTIWLDLKKSKRKLLSGMKAKTRYNIGLARRRGVKTKIYSGKEVTKPGLVLDSFFDLLRQNARRLGIFPLPRKWLEGQLRAFGTKCFVVLAFSKGELVAGNFFMVSSNTCFYSHNGSTETGRKLAAPTLCTWNGVMEAKERKLNIFDFDGIYDGRSALKRWRGFTRFKQGFGGKEIAFDGMYFKILNFLR